jgi:hypothetical protein
MIDDMVLAGLSDRTQEVYISAVRRLAARYHRSPDQITEDEVRAYLLELLNGGAARGTFKTSHYGIRFLYCQTIGCDWALFGKKRFASPSRSGCPRLFPMLRCASFWAASGSRSTGAAFH